MYKQWFKTKIIVVSYKTIYIYISEVLLLLKNEKFIYQKGIAKLGQYIYTVTIIIIKLWTGIYKKLELKGKSSKKGYQGIARWSRSISNHMYWCAASSNGNGEELVQKWQSVLKHCANVHDGHGDLFPNCLHGPLEDREWIKMGKQLIYKFKFSTCSICKICLNNTLVFKSYYFINLQI